MTIDNGNDNEEIALMNDNIAFSQYLFFIFFWDTKIPFEGALRTMIAMTMTMTTYNTNTMHNPKSMYVWIKMRCVAQRFYFILVTIGNYGNNSTKKTNAMNKRQ